MSIALGRTARLRPRGQGRKAGGERGPSVERKRHHVRATRERIERARGARNGALERRERVIEGGAPVERGHARGSVGVGCGRRDAVVRGRVRAREGMWVGVGVRMLGGHRRNSAAACQRPASASVSVFILEVIVEMVSVLTAMSACVFSL